MSESNKDDIKKNKKIIIGAIIFITVCVTIIMICISSKKKTNTNFTFNSQILNKIVPQKNNKKVVKLTDKAKFNGIHEISKKESYGEIDDEYGNKKLEISYVQIDGLKNKDIQEKINKSIKNKVNELKEKRMEDLDNTNIDKMAINALVYGDFSDVLSICVTESIDYNYGNENYEYKNNEYGLNFALATGDIIQFNDMFWEDSSVNTILSQNLYKSLHEQYYYDDEDSYDDDKIDIEEKISKFMNKYNKNSNINFYFTSSDIVIPDVEDEECYLAMIDFYEDISIYSKYKTSENLYDGNPELRDFYVFSYNPLYPEYIDDSMIDSGYKFDNIYFTVYCCDNYNEMSDEEKEAIKNVKKIILNKVDEYAQKLKPNTEYGYIIEGLYVLSNEDDEKYGYNINIEISQCSKDFFDKHLEEALAAGARHPKTDVGPDNYEYIDDKNFDFYESYLEWSNDYTDESAKESSTYTLEEKLKDENLSDEEQQNT